MEPERQCLVIGYGNTLRRDDGVGVEVAQTIAAMKLHGVNVITHQQLVPELAAPISESRAVIFVDADPNAKNEAALKPIEASSSVEIMAHAPNPGSLLALARELFGRHPRAWSLAVPAEDFGYGIGLSPRSQLAVRAAAKLIQELVTA